MWGAGPASPAAFALPWTGDLSDSLCQNAPVDM